MNEMLNESADEPMSESEIRELLDAEAERINSPAFIADDPVQFPRRFERLADIETVAFLSAIIAWGNRRMICRDAERILDIMGDHPADYVLDRAYEDLDPAMNLHRTFFAANFQHFLRGLREIFRRYGSVDAFSAAIGAGADDAPAWKLVGEINRVMAAANEGRIDSRALPQNLRTTALKRVNMALRWLVRDDGIVDMGVWTSIPKSKLYIPLDVHVGNTARRLGLIDRKANDRRTVELLTSRLRSWRPDDPAIYDYALFGIGVGGGNRD
ncbi:MAG: TIGR02757 family protein [Muribaculaceae bacterium]|nr:TIGR02757 family protein [Muribaculaceae bacterium]